MYNIIEIVTLYYILPLIISIIQLRLTDKYNRKILAPIVFIPAANIFLIFVLTLYFLLVSNKYIILEILNFIKHE